MDEDKALSQFINESYQNVNNFEAGLFKLEKNFQDLNLLQSLYRNMHTIKGAVGFFSFRSLENLVHSAEDIFSNLNKLDEDKRSEKFNEHKLINIFFEITDEVKKQLNSIKLSKKEDPSSSESLIDKLIKLKSDLEQNKIEDSSAAEPAVKRKRQLSPSQLKALTKLKNNGQQKEIENKVSLDQNIIIRQDTLDNLSILNSELVQARNQMSALIDETDISLYSSFRNIDNLTQRISNRISGIRMQPISLISNQLKKLTRDLSQRLEKEVDLIITGDELEVDRTILDAIKDPLLHIIRNSIDHGIESPSERETLTKNPIGLIKIEIKYSDSRLKISIDDDGRGLNKEKILKKALKQGLLDEKESLEMSEDDIYQLIFRPGFSTSDTVSEISGRGMGMDIVIEALKKINGSIELYSKKEMGTTFDLSMPLTLALASAIIVDIDKQKFAIPQSYVKRLGSVSLNEINENGQIKIEEELVDLCPGRIITDRNFRNLDFLELEEKHSGSAEKIEFILLEINYIEFALMVDSVIDRQDIVVKPLPIDIKSLNIYIGSSIMADGQIALILDIEKLYSRIINQEEQIKIPQVKTKKTNDLSRILSFKSGEHDFAVNYSLVKEITTKKIVTEIPGSKTEVLMNIRDTVILSKRINEILELKKPKKSHDIAIVLDLAGDIFSLQVDDINEIISIDDDFEEIESQFDKLVSKTYKIQDKLIHLVDEYETFRAN